MVRKDNLTFDLFGILHFHFALLLCWSFIWNNIPHVRVYDYCLHAILQSIFNQFESCPETVHGLLRAYWYTYSRHRGNLHAVCIFGVCLHLDFMGLWPHFYTHTHTHTHFSDYKKLFTLGEGMDINPLELNDSLHVLRVLCLDVCLSLPAVCTGIDRKTMLFRCTVCVCVYISSRDSVCTLQLPSCYN